MSNHTFQTGDRAIVARPQHPSGFEGGEKVTVLAVYPAPGLTDRMLKVVDESGAVAGVWTSELDPEA